MPAKDPLIYVRHMQDCCDRILEYARKGGPDWTSDSLFMDAVCRNLEIIGEAARKLDEAFRLAHPEIPWRPIIAMRNVVIHAYEYLRTELIREMVEDDVPELRKHCARLLGQDPR